MKAGVLSLMKESMAFSVSLHVFAIYEEALSSSRHRVDSLSKQQTQSSPKGALQQTTTTIMPSSNRYA